MFHFSFYTASFESMVCCVLADTLTHASSVPHPSENHIHLRIQMYGQYIQLCTSHYYYSCQKLSDHLSSLEALLEALNNLDNLCDTVEESYNTSLTGGSFERWDEKS